MSLSHFKKFLAVSFTAAFIVTVLSPAELKASDGWIVFRSPSKLYRVKIPEDYSTNNTTMMTSLNRAVKSEEVVAVVDQRPYKDIVKNYIIKVDQTIGPPFHRKEAQAIIKEELALYKDIYTGMNGVIRQQKNGKNKGLTFHEIYITYQDPDYGEQAIRYRIYLTDISKVQQMSIGPPDSIFDFRTLSFFDSMRIEYGMAPLSNKDKEKWTAHTSPRNLYTLFLPPKAKGFYESDPVVKNNDDMEYIGTFFEDPVRKQRLFYNTYGYKFNATLDFGDVYKVLATNHFSKYRMTAPDVEYKRKFVNGVPTIDVEFSIPPLKGYPYAKYIKMRAKFQGGLLVVQEMVGSYLLTKSQFAQNLINYTKFHPQKYGTPLPATPEEILDEMMEEIEEYENELTESEDGEFTEPESDAEDN